VGRVSERISKQSGRTDTVDFSNAERYREMLVAANTEIDHLKSAIHDLEEAKYGAYKRINELLQEVSNLSTQASESK